MTIAADTRGTARARYHPSLPVLQPLLPLLLLLLLPACFYIGALTPKSSSASYCHHTTVPANTVTDLPLPLETAIGTAAFCYHCH